MYANLTLIVPDPYERYPNEGIVWTQFQARLDLWYLTKYNVNLLMGFFVLLSAYAASVFIVTVYCTTCQCTLGTKRRRSDERPRMA